MADQADVEWLRRNERTLLARFRAAAREHRRSTGFSSLDDEALERAMRREVAGLESFMRSDFGALKVAVGEHKAHAETFMAGIPIDEQLAFLERRLKILEELLDDDPTAAPFREAFRARLDVAVSYYRSVAHNIAARQRLNQY